VWRRYLYERAGDGPGKEGLQPFPPSGLFAIRIWNCLVTARTAVPKNNIKTRKVRRLSALRLRVLGGLLGVPPNQQRDGQAYAEE